MAETVSKEKEKLFTVSEWTQRKEHDTRLTRFLIHETYVEEEEENKHKKNWKINKFSDA